MTTTRQAKYLSGVDRGKHVEFVSTAGKYTGPYRISGPLIAVKHLGDGTTTLIVQSPSGAKYGDVPADTKITITGTSTTAGLDLHRSVLDQDG